MKYYYEKDDPSPNSPEASGENPFVSAAADTKDLKRIAGLAPEKKICFLS